MIAGGFSKRRRACVHRHKAIIIMIAWFDIESTGLRPVDNVYILEVAVVLAHPHTQVVRAEYVDLVKPPTVIPQAASDANGIYDKDVADKPSFSQIAPFVHNMFHNNIWAGHNIRRFDIPLLLEEFKRCKMEPPVCMGTIDTLDFANRHFAGRPGLTRTRLETLARYFDLIPPKGKQTHRALDDVHLNIRVAQRMFSQVYLETALLGPQMSPLKLDLSQPPGGTPMLTHSDEHKSVHEGRCSAITLKGHQCKKRACGAAGKDRLLCEVHFKIQQQQPQQQGQPAPAATPVAVATAPTVTEQAIADTLKTL